jgi:pimeloyl-ACP methyl ester carboxylesterase
MTLPPPDPDLLPDLLPPGVRSRFIDGLNGLRVHLLEAGDPAAPCVLLLHGFPEIAFSWRKILPLLAASGYHAVAPDLRGYGRTATRPTAFNEDLAPYRMANRLRDALCLVSALGRRRVAVVGHDYGAWIAGFCALARPDVFASLTLMSAPFAGAPSLAELPASLRPPIEDPIHADLAALGRPRKHYHAYFATASAAADMDGPEHRVAAFLRAYFHHKSADWPGNAPHTLPGWTAAALAAMPTYYIMDRDRTMPETVAPEMPEDAGAACPWLTPAELSVYARDYARTGFGGALQGYRVRMDGSLAGDLALFAGRHVEVPALFISGRQDWGPFQGPGALARMQTVSCPRMEACHLLEGAGHWVQQERPEEVAELLTGFLRRAAPPGMT